jgi:DNA helicase HerA-like ATPase
MNGDRLGLVVEGSLVEGLRARLDASVEDIRVGSFVKIEGEQQDFFCLITDVQLGATDPQMLQDPPDLSDDYLRQVLAGTASYGTLKLQPMLMLPKAQLDLAGPAGPRPVRTIPTHFSSVLEADRDDFELVFGKESDHRFQIGKPLDMDVPVCLDLKRFVERSNGVFGKSGTGKSFLTRLLLCGVVKSDDAVNLIFDMHSEYGHRRYGEDGQLVEGLQDLFGRQRVKVFGLETGAGGAGPAQTDGTISIGLNEIEIEDVALLQDELKLNPTAVETANLLYDRYQDRWMLTLLEMAPDDQKAFADQSGAHPGALAALRRKLAQIRRLEFVHDHREQSNVGLLLDHLLSGRHVVLEFGRFSQALHYMLIANVLTRRIHREWSDRMDRARLSGRPAEQPPALMITIEEAHKFLSSKVADQTIFGTIAREMRKYQVTLLVVDQRPSGIDDEVLSQIGTRATCLLNDERDIEAVFSGVSGANRLKSILATLESKEQAMILGHAVPMPVVIQTRKYDDEFYRALRPWGSDPLAVAAQQKAKAREYDALFGSDDD